MTDRPWRDVGRALANLARSARNTRAGAMARPINAGTPVSQADRARRLADIADRIDGGNRTPARNATELDAYRAAGLVGELPPDAIIARYYRGDGVVEVRRVDGTVELHHPDGTIEAP